MIEVDTVSGMVFCGWQTILSNKVDEWVKMGAL